ncbi:DUF1365 domain-containing protein [bacterium]|nr:DUF1365 domain-containing protein [bacterium]
MNSCIYEGRLRHRRFKPVEHAFEYPLFMMFLDLSELDDVFAGRWLWSARRPSLAWFRRADHLGDPEVPLEKAVRDLVEDRTGRRPEGPIAVLAHLRYFGYAMNPVSFYYCYHPLEPRVETIVAEVNNTPWGEQHWYVLNQRIGSVDENHARFRFAKNFHVSPFMGMDIEYDWRFTRPGRQLAVHMECVNVGDREFDATLTLARRPINGRELARVLSLYPAMTGKVVAAIYWQALRLWWKRAPFHPHPRRLRKTGEVPR